MGTNLVLYAILNELVLYFYVFQLLLLSAFIIDATALDFSILEPCLLLVENAKCFLVACSIL